MPRSSSPSASFSACGRRSPTRPVVLIAGNHDTPRSAETGSILGLFRELGVDVAADDARRFSYPHLDLSIFAVPHPALSAGERPLLRPDGPERHQVLVIHGEVEGVLPAERSAVEYGGAVVTPAEIAAGEWSYVAFGHYHVRHQLGPRAWYAGALDYVSPNLWGELQDESERGVRGKGWLLADLETGVVSAQPIAPPRRVLDLAPIEGEGLAAAALDALISERIRAVDGGIADQVVRLIVRGVPRHVMRELDHTAIRALKAEALHLQLDIRRPEVNRETGVGAPGRRQTLPEMVRAYLAHRALPASVDRERFVAIGSELVESAEREAPAG
jgi:hypothetical protein